MGAFLVSLDRLKRERLGGQALYLRLLNVQFLRYLVVGAFNTGFSYSIYALLLFVGLEYFWANLGSFIVGLLVSFKTQGALVFKNDDKSRISKFLGVWVVLFGLNIALIAAFRSLGLNSYWAGAAALIPVVIASFLLQRSFVFNRRPSSEHP